MDATEKPTLWTPCPRVFDAPLMAVLGFEMFDVGLLLVLLFGGFLLRPFIGLPPWIPLLVALAGVVVLWTGKRGKPRGALQHTLHEADLLPLPGVLPPTNQGYHHWNFL